MPITCGPSRRWRERRIGESSVMSGAALHGHPAITFRKRDITGSIGRYRGVTGVLSSLGLRPSCNEILYRSEALHACAQVSRRSAITLGKPSAT
jgi:hypothetical protein